MSLCLRYLCLCLCVLLNLGIAQAQEDPRFNISLNFEADSRPTVNEQVKQALPILWDRIITQQARPNVPKNIQAMGLLRRIRPEQSKSNIQFNPSRVWALLEKQGIPHIRTLPSFNLRIELTNAFGSSMQGSENALLAYAQKQASILGVQLKPNAPLLAIRIQWLDDVHAQLSARGQSQLGEFSETRNLDMGDPFIQLKSWVKQTMLRARDAYVWQPAVVENAGNITASAAPSLHLLFEQKANLSEQIALETALQSDPRVQSLLPIYLNYHSREYTIQLKLNDDSWIADWFTQRGMIASPNEQGWLIH